VIEVLDLTQESFVERELVMIKVPVNGNDRTAIIEVANIFRAKVVDINPGSMIVEATGSEGKIRAFIDMMGAFGIRELVRTGRIAVARSLKNSE
ncbi:MAG: acetolactate synthase small subunit, partial [Candidatus Hydrogenedentes bacterium]|nr:acetolactate synthase small subunit [Candidatus Hydrogenedentota bacterium]